MCVQLHQYIKHYKSVLLYFIQALKVYVYKLPKTNLLVGEGSYGKKKNLTVTQAHK